jgi:hypothetical protein
MFSFLGDSLAQIDVVSGDARLSELTRGQNGDFGVPAIWTDDHSDSIRVVVW